MHDSYGLCVHTCTMRPWRPEVGVRSPVTEVTERPELPMWAFAESLSLLLCKHSKPFQLLT